MNVNVFHEVHDIMWVMLKMSIQLCNVILGWVRYCKSCFEVKQLNKRIDFTCFICDD